MILYGAVARVALAGPMPPPFDPSEWENHVSVVVGLAALALLYLWAVGPLRRRGGVTGGAGPWRVVSFFAGLAVMYLVLDGPLDDLSDSYLFSMHMVQHLALTQLVAPLLILGTPAFALRPLLRPGWVRAAGEALSRPAVAFLVYALTYTVWHLPAPYDLMVRHDGLHVLVHLEYMVTGVIMWWPVLTPLPEYRRLASGGAILYLFLLGIPMMAVAAWITLTPHLLYPFYSAAPRVWGLSPLDDQRLGGLIMWVPGGAFYWIATAGVFFAWASRERRADAERGEEPLVAPAPPGAGRQRA